MTSQGLKGLIKKWQNYKAKSISLVQKERLFWNVLKGAENLEVDDKWVEIERNEDRAIFGLLSGVYSIQGKQIEMEQKQSMNTNLELSRGMLARDQTIRELLSIHLAE